MADPIRTRQLAGRIQQIVASTLERRIKDPRLGFVTITDVRMTGDLQHASIFYTVFGDESERASSAAALESAKGIIRSAVGRGTRLRLTPTIEFIPDALPETSAEFEEALARARQADAELAAKRGTEYAGDPDPYKVPVDPADADEPDEDEADEDDFGDDYAEHEPAGDDL